MNGNKVFTNFQTIVSSLPPEELHLKYGTANLKELFKRSSKGNLLNSALRSEWRFVSNCAFGAFSSEWYTNGDEDPHGNYYHNSTRGELACGTLTDDQLANLAYMENDVFFTRTNPVNGNLLMPIVIATAVKERIRWLSRRCVKLENKLAANNIALEVANSN